MTAAAAPPGLLWRAMTAGDLAAVADISRVVHPAYPEDDAVFRERLTLYPQGCRVLAADDGAPQGYVLSHPWDGPPPRLNTLLGAIPPAARRYYIHDLTLLPDRRGGGAASAVVPQLLDAARRNGFTTAALVAVNGSDRFWARHGFRIAHDPAHDPALAAVLRSYGAGVHYMTRDLRA